MLLDRGDVRLKFVRLQWVYKRVSVKFIVTFNADLEGAVGLGPCDTQYDVAIVDLTIVQSHLAALIDFSSNEFQQFSCIR